MAYSSTSSDEESGRTIGDISQEMMRQLNSRLVQSNTVNQLFQELRSTDSGVRDFLQRRLVQKNLDSIFTLYDHLNSTNKNTLCSRISSLGSNPDIEDTQNLEQTIAARGVIRLIGKAAKRDKYDFFQDLVNAGCWCHYCDSERRTQGFLLTRELLAGHNKIANTMLESDLKRYQTAKQFLYADALKEIEPLLLQKQLFAGLHLIKTYEGRFAFAKGCCNNRPEALLRGKFLSSEANWIDVAGAEFQYRWIIDPTGQIVTVDGNNAVDWRLCSGFLIAPDLFLTAGHCVDANVGDVCYSNPRNYHVANMRISFNYQFPNFANVLGSGANVLGSGTIVETFQKFSLVERGKCSGQDYAVFKLDIDAPQCYGNIRLSTEVPEIGTTLCMAQHPSGETKKFAKGNLLSISREGDFIRYAIDTAGGSSGSPVGRHPQRDVVAVHVSAWDATSNRGLTIAAILKNSELLKQRGFFSGLQENTHSTSTIGTNNRATNFNRPHS